MMKDKSSTLTVTVCRLSLPSLLLVPHHQMHHPSTDLPDPVHHGTTEPSHGEGESSESGRPPYRTRVNRSHTVGGPLRSPIPRRPPCPPSLNDEGFKPLVHRPFTDFFHGNEHQHAEGSPIDMSYRVRMSTSSSGDGHGTRGGSFLGGGSGSGRVRGLSATSSRPQAHGDGPDHRHRHHHKLPSLSSLGTDEFRSLILRANSAEDVGTSALLSSSAGTLDGSYGSSDLIRRTLSNPWSGSLSRPGWTAILTALGAGGGEGAGVMEAAGEGNQTTSTEFPLSPHQQHLYKLSQTLPSRMHMSLAARVVQKGQSVPQLKTALARLLERHHSLRTAYIKDGSGDDRAVPRQRIMMQEASLDWAEVKGSWDDAEELRRVVQEEAERPFDLAAGCLMRARIFHHTNNQGQTEAEGVLSEGSVLLLVFHRLAVDLWSILLLLDDLRILMMMPLNATVSSSASSSSNPHRRQLVHSRTATMPPQLYQMTMDYSIWMNEMFPQTPEGKALVPYWLKKLTGELPVSQSFADRRDRAGELSLLLLPTVAVLLVCRQILNLPTDYPRPAKTSYHGSSYAFTVPSLLLKKLFFLCQSEGATLYSALLGVYMTMLSRYTGQTDILVGSPTACRNRLNLKNVVGDMVNTVVLRGDLSGNPDFRSLLRRLRKEVNSSMAHAQYPFDRLLDMLELQPEAQDDDDSGRQPIFQVMFYTCGRKQHWQAAEAFTWMALGHEGSRVKLGGLQLESMGLSHHYAPCDLTLVMTEDAQGDGHAPVALQYNAEIFSRDTIGRMVSHFCLLLESVVHTPNARVGSLPMVPSDELSLLRQWNDQQKMQEFADPIMAHQLLERQAQLTPHAPALIDNATGRLMAYSELNETSNRLARHLRELGVGPDVLVAICMPKCPELYVCLLAVLKAGGAYCPLDSSYPLERLHYMLNDTGSPVLLTHTSLLDKLHGQQPSGDNNTSSQHIVCVDRDWEAALQGKEGNNLTVEDSHPKDLCYTIYTSGSTGKPKGVCLPHAALVNLILWQTTRPSFRPALRTLQFAPMSFDVHFQELFTAWASGGSIVLVQGSVRRDSFALVRFMQQLEVQRAFLPFVALNQLCQAYESLRSGNHKDPPPALYLQEVITAGEQLQVTPAVRSFFHHTGAKLLNHYGPSETHVCTALSMEGRPEEWPALPCIGRPVANCRIYILDELLQEVPIGVPGELCVGGVCLARGYWQRPELTSKRFLETEKFGRIYKTGDLARFKADGTVEYMGRIDTQVKVRGFRVELGEVESVLDKYPSVKKCLVVVREDAPGDKRLVAYVVLDHEATTSTGPATTTDGDAISEIAALNLRRHVAAACPDYMVPSAFVILDAFPFTPSGKVDRSALPAPTYLRSGDGNAPVFVAPRTETETRLTQLISQILGVPSIGVHDNFYALGGHSLSVTRFLAQVREAFAMLVLDDDYQSLGEVFQANPTVAALASHLEAAVTSNTTTAGASSDATAVTVTRRRPRRSSQPPDSDNFHGPLQQDLLVHQQQAQDLTSWGDMDTSSGLSLSREGANTSVINGFPLSDMQASIFTSSQLSDDFHCAYNIPLAMRFADACFVAMLKDALQGVLDRHSALRTAFVSTTLGPRQTVLENVRLPWREQHAHSEDDLSSNLEEEAYRPFDLASGQLMRAVVFKKTDSSAGQGNVLLVTFHHIAVDLWSLVIILNDLRALLSGRGLVPTYPSYLHYAGWQQKQVLTHVGELQAQYWERTLQDAPVLNLPTDFHRPSIQTCRGSTVQLQGIPSGPLRDLAKREGCSAYVVLLSAFMTLLHRYTGQEDIVVGTPVANRNRQETQSIVGYFVNPCAMRGHLSSNSSFKALIHQMKRVVSGALANQEYPFSLLVDRLHKSRDHSRPPLVQVMFALQTAFTDENDLTGLILGTPADGEGTKAVQLGPGLSVQPVPVGQRYCPFDLVVSMAEDTKGTSFTASLQYNTDLFERETIERMGRHLRRLLDSIGRDPDQCLAKLRLMEDCELQTLLHDWNGTEFSFPRDSCLHHLVEGAARRFPDRLAVWHGGRQITYTELDERANAVATQLTSLPRWKGLETPVAVMIPRSADMVLAFLAVLKAGGAYTPLDPCHPPDRIAYMLRDAGTLAILANSTVLNGRLREVLPLRQNDEMLNIELVLVDAFGGARQSMPPTLGDVLSPRNLCNIIYTSGSTGKPKGVMVEHRGLVSMVSWLADALLEVSEDDRGSQVFGMGFDGTAIEIWPLLIRGGAVYIVDDETRTQPERLASFLAEHGITQCALPTPLAEALLRGGEAYVLPGFRVRNIVTGGDKLHRGLDKDRALPPFSLVNLYGPTEASVMCTYHKVVQSPDPPPIGRPNGNTLLYVVDTASLEPVPIGVPGELLIGGIGVARGYLNQPDLTQSRFIKNPFVQKACAREGCERVYKAGDLVRYRSDGNLEFLGRIDSQVKIRGFRIELSEIETVLLASPLIREAAVVVREDGDDKRLALVAYVVPDINKEARAVSLRELRVYLSSQLPDYMVPPRFVIMHQLPMNANGKVDRKALPSAGCDEMEAEDDAFVAPRTEYEEILMDMFCDLLGLERVGVNQNFFELGGHSLLATQLVSRIRKALGVEVSLARIFETPTLAGLAGVVEAAYMATNVLDPSRKAAPHGSITELLRQGDNEATSQALLAEQQEEGGTQHPASFNQSSLYFMWLTNKDSAAFNVVLPARLLSRPVNLYALRSSLQALVDRHATLRTVYLTGGEEHGPHRVQQWVHAPGTWAVDLQVVELGDEGDVTARMEEDSHLPFDLHNGPVFRAWLYDGGRLKGRDSTSTGVGDSNGDLMHLMLVWHHIAVDGWSVAVMLEELGVLYTACCKAEQPLDQILAPLPVSYPQFSRWQELYLTQPEGEHTWAYWQRQLAGVECGPAISLLPTDKPRPSVQTFRGDLPVTFRIPASLTKAATQLARVEAATLHSLLLSVWMVLLHRYSGGQEDVLVGSPMAGRTEIELENLVGYLVNPVVMRARFTEGLTFQGLLHNVSQAVIAGMVHQTYPFALLVDRLGVPRDPSRSPLFQTFFVLERAYGKKNNAHISNFLMGQTGSVLKLSEDLLLGSIRLPQRIAQFDVTLAIADVDGELRASLQYNADLFSRATMVGISRAYVQLLENAVGTPAIPLAHLQMLSSDEMQHVMVDLNDRARLDVPTAGNNMRDLFDRAALANPDNMALSGPTLSGSPSEVTLTYRELDKLTNRIGNFLKAQGVGPETAVAILLRRSVAMVVAILGVVKAGGAYVPLDPAYPVDRLTYMLGTSKARVLITERHALTTDRHPSSTMDLATLYVDGEDQRSASSEEEWANVGPYSDLPCSGPLCGPRDCLYIAFTSGSTGRPKAIAVEHSNILNLVAWHHREYRITAADRASQLVAPAFDPVGLELWPFLTAGASVHVISDEVRGSPPQLLAALARLQITVALLPTALCEVLLMDQQPPQWPTSLRVLYTGGEKLRRGPPQRTAFRVDNHYGPAETAIMTTFYTVSSKEVSPPIGWPVANAKLFVVDTRTLNPLPMGVPGELLIGGKGVARGYIDLPDETKRRFIANPFTGKPGLPTLGEGCERLYRTGDLVRYRSDGALEFLGRIDASQVKIRGHRIELGEIEAVLLASPLVRAAAVVDVEDPHRKEKRLVAYIVLTSSSSSGQGAAAAKDELQQALARSLPEYMIPSMFLFLPSVPLTHNQKLDRSALPCPDWSKGTPSGCAAYNDPQQQRALDKTGDHTRPPPQEPSDPTEAALLSIFRQVLGLSDGSGAIGVHDNFFDLGGHSIAAAHLISRIHKEFRVAVPVTRVFQSPTVKELSPYIISASAQDPSHTMHSPGGSSGKFMDEGEERERQTPQEAATSGSAGHQERKGGEDMTMMHHNDDTGARNNHRHQHAGLLDLPNDVWPVVTDEEEPFSTHATATTTRSKNKKQHKRPGAVFLTGATGFLGAFLLHELLVQTRHTVYCLVRAPDAQAGYARVLATLARYELLGQHQQEGGNDTVRARVIIVPGDLAMTRFGLSASAFTRLAQGVDAIYHSGSMVNFLWPLRMLQAANVGGTVEVLRLAAAHHDKPVHYVSTLSVFGSGRHLAAADGSNSGGGDGVVVVTEDDPLAPPSDMYGGYALSKWVAEQLLVQARERGFQVGIYRPGRITAASTTGATNLDDIMYRMVKGVVQVGYYPTLQWSERTASVDFCARAIVSTAEREVCLGKNVHVVGTEAFEWEEVFQWVASYGYHSLQPLPLHDWLEKMAESGPGGGSSQQQQQSSSASGGEEHDGREPNAMYALLPVLYDVGVESDMPAFDNKHLLDAILMVSSSSTSSSGGGDDDDMDDSQGSGGRPPILFHVDEEEEERSAAGERDLLLVRKQKLDEDALHQCMDYMVRVGFLPPPPGLRIEDR